KTRSPKAHTLSNSCPVCVHALSQKNWTLNCIPSIRKLDLLQLISGRFRALTQLPGAPTLVRYLLTEYDSKCNANVFIIANAALWYRRTEYCDCRCSAPGA